MTDPVLQVERLGVTFPGGPDAVRDVDLAVRSGEVVALVGESGSGKSLTALAIMGLLPHTARPTGSVRLQGRELLGCGDRELSRHRGRDLAMVFQDPQSSLTPVYSIGDQIAEAVRVHTRLNRRAARHRAAELLDLVGLPASRAGAFPHECSGGMLQRVAIAMAVAHGPAVILADEPTTALDVTIQAQVLDVLTQARRASGAALLLITHDLAIAAGRADRVLVMYAGRIVEDAPAATLFNAPAHPYTAGLLLATPDPTSARLPTPIRNGPPATTGCAFAPRCALARPICRTAPPPTTHPSADTRVSCWAAAESAHPAGLVQPGTLGGGSSPGSGSSAAGRARAGSTAPGGVAGPRSVPRAERDTVLRVEDLGAGVLAGVGFTVQEGETLALVGESGSGKTTVLMSIMALRAPVQGRVVVLGQDTAGLHRADRLRLRRRLQLVFQDATGALDPRLPVAGLLAEPLRAAGIERRDVPARVQELLGLVGLDHGLAARLPSALSGGQRQRVGIARALALRPRILLLDEPVSALDVSVQAEILHLLADLRDRLGLTYVLVSHDLAVVRGLADRVAVLHRGRLVEIAETEHLYTAPQDACTRALLAALPAIGPATAPGRARVRTDQEGPGV